MTPTPSTPTTPAPRTPRRRGVPPPPAPEEDSERVEHLVADVWARLGWGTRVVGAPGDCGIDVVASYFDDIELRENVDRGEGASIEAEAGATTLRDRLRGQVGALFS